MIVVDASVLANVVGDDGEPGRRTRACVLATGSISAPDLVDVETVSVLRRHWLRGGLTDERFRLAVADLAALPLNRFPAGPLMARAFELRSNVTPYDACYVALAEALDCPLLTADERLANAPGIECSIELLRD